MAGLFPGRAHTTATLQEVGGGEKEYRLFKISAHDEATIFDLALNGQAGQPDQARGAMIAHHTRVEIELVSRSLLPGMEVDLSELRKECEQNLSRADLSALFDKAADYNGIDYERAVEKLDADQLKKL